MVLKEFKEPLDLKVFKELLVHKVPKVPKVLVVLVLKELLVLKVLLAPELVFQAQLDQLDPLDKDMLLIQHLVMY
jgi:hypothetical protein